MKYELGILGLTLMMWSCGSAPTREEIVEEIVEKKQELRYFATTNARNLRLRSTPDLQGDVVEIINIEGSMVEYMQDSTTFETQVGQGSTAMLGRWYKIKSEAGNEGWAFGPLLVFKNSSENKAITAQKKAEALQFAKDSASLGGSTAVVKRKRDNGVVDMGLMGQYNSYLQRLSDKNVYSVSSAANELQRICQSCSPATADQAFISFRGLMVRVETQVKRSFNASKYNHLRRELLEYGRVHAAQDSTLRRLEDNGFKLGIIEGQIQLEVDIDYLARQFYRLVSPEMRTYFNQIQLESETYWQENKKLLVPAKKIGDWAVFWSNFADKNQNFILAGEARQKTREFLQILVFGLQNSPVFDEKKMLKADFKEAYEHIIEISADSEIGERILNYYKTLQESNFSKNGYVEQAQLEFFN